MNKKEKNLEGLEGFSEETLNEMAMEEVEGGVDDVNAYCGNNKGCNVVAGCACYGG